MSENSWKSFVLFSLFLFMVGIFFILSFFHIFLLSFLGLPFWMFFIPICLWEFYFWALGRLWEENLMSSYLVILLSIVLLSSLWHWWLFFLWNAIMVVITGYNVWTNTFLRKKSL